jgi:hypothetical protein
MHGPDDQEERGRFAVPGEDSHESEETLSPDERGEDEEQPQARSEPKQPAPRKND